MAQAYRKTKVLKARREGKYLVCRLAAPWRAEEVRPGRFMMVRIPGDGEMMFGRPFGISRKGEGWVEFTAAVAGRGTRILYDTVEEGSDLDVLGPLGNGYDIPAAAERIILAGGGAGVPELLALAEELAAEGRPPVFIAGARSEADLVLLDELRRASRELMVVTEDGSAGEKGLVTAPLGRRLAEEGADLVAACGPTPMLHAVAEMCAERGVECLVAAEERMACGVGACYGCCIPVLRGGEVKMVRVCLDGPVFRGEEFTGGRRG